MADPERAPHTTSKTAIARLTHHHKAADLPDRMNARREAEYVARRNGVKPALLQIYTV